MIKYVQGDIFELAEKYKVEVIVNPVNCVGVMGAGLAKQFKIKYPEHFQYYINSLKNKDLGIGKVQFVHPDANVEKTKQSSIFYIALFPTKNDWRNPSRMEYISLGLQSLIKKITLTSTTSIILPPLGCGLGGLEWEDVKKEIELYMLDLKETDIYVVEPLT